MPDEYKFACEACVGNPHLFESRKTSLLTRCTYCEKNIHSAAPVGAMASDVAARLATLIDSSKSKRPVFRHHQSVGTVIRTNLHDSALSFVQDLTNIVGRATLPVSLAADQQHLWIFDREDYDGQDREWNKFKTLLRSGNRFFNQEALVFLDQLFETLGKLSAGGLINEVKPASELKAGRTLFRARRINSHEELPPILSNLKQELHAPPPNRTPANRMNVERSPAFYAALQSETAIAETRPSIGSRVVVGAFKTTRSLKMLDFTVLSRSGGVHFSIWEANFVERAVMRGLLRRLQERIGRPIPAGAEHEYLETQVVADYLRFRGEYDGVLFESSQEEGGTNVVLFSGTLGAYCTETKTFPHAPLAYVDKSAVLHKVDKVKILTKEQGSMSYE